MQNNKRDYSALKSRIIKYLQLKGITKYVFYKNTGITNGILSQNNGISEDNLLRFVAYYKDVNPNWLLTGKGAILLSEFMEHTPAAIVGSTTIHTFQKSFPHQQDVMVAEQQIPVYELEAGLSLNLLFSNSLSPQGYITLPNISKCDGAFRMWGDRMSPEIQSGDLIIFSKVEDLRSGLFFGQIYLLSIELEGMNYVTVQYVAPSDRQNFIKLVNKNDLYSSRKISIESIRSLAMVKAIVRSF